MTRKQPPLGIPVSWTTRAFRSLSYLAIGLSGLWIMLNALAYLPTHLLGVIIVLVWGMFILVALPAAITALYGLYRIEYFLLPWFGGGMVLACIGTWLSTVFKDYSLGPRALMVTALVFLVALRYSSLQELVRLNRENHVGDEDE